MLRAHSLLVYLFLCTVSYAQTPPAIEWQRALGGSGSDEGFSLEQTADGGYIVAGWSTSSNGNVTGNHGYYDFWVAKLSSDGVLQWQRSLGGTGGDYAFRIHQTSDLGYIVVGGSDSNDGDVSGNHGNSDVWVVKLDVVGTIQWQRSLGGTASDVAGAIVQTADDGYIIAGETSSNDGDVTGNHGYNDVWVVRLDSTGTLIWQRTYGGTSGEFATAIVETGDGGYVVAAASDSNDGDVTGNHGGIYDYWLMKVDGNGNLQWQRACGGSGFDRPKSVVATSNGGFVAVGSTDSNDGDITGNHGGYDCWVVVLDGNGTLQWQKSLGGSGGDGGESIIEAADGDLILAGSTGSDDGDVTMNHGGGDAWAVRFSNSGTLLWQKSMGGTNADYAYQIVSSNDGGYAFVGETNSNNGDVSGNHGNLDFWVVKLALDPTSVRELSPPPDFTIWPNPAMAEIHIEFDAHSPVQAGLEVYDNIGQMIRSYSHSGAQALFILPTDDLAPGTYRIRVITDGMATSQSFVKW